MGRYTSLHYATLAVALMIFDSSHGLTSTNTPKASTTNSLAETYTFSVPLQNAKPKPDSAIDTLVELWNDPRPITSLIAADDRSYVGERENANGSGKKEIPYCIISDEFEIEDESFQILLYPRGRFVRDYSSSTSSSSSSTDNISTTITGPASAYLRYLPKKY